MKTNELIVNNIPFSKQTSLFSLSFDFQSKFIEFPFSFFFTNEWKSITTKKREIRCRCHNSYKTDLKLKMKKNKKKKNSN